MFIDDFIAALSSAIKDIQHNNSNILRIEVDASERKKRARVNIVIENKRENKIGFWGAMVKCAPYLVILVFGYTTLWGLFEIPRCRVTKISTCAKEHTCVVTNAFGNVFKIVQDTKSCVTNRWE